MEYSYLKKAKEKRLFYRFRLSKKKSAPLDANIKLKQEEERKLNLDPQPFLRLLVVSFT